MKKFFKFLFINTLKILIILGIMFCGVKLLDIYLNTPSDLAVNNVEEYSNLTISNVINDDSNDKNDKPKNQTVTEAVTPVIGQVENNTVASSFTVSSNDCFYNNISVISKKVYQKYGQSINKMKSGTYAMEFGSDFSDFINTQGSQLFLDEISNGINAYNNDHTGTFFIDETKFNIGIRSVTVGSKKTNYVTISAQEGSNYFADQISSQAQCNDYFSNLENQKNQILQNAPRDNDYNKIKYVHDWLVDNVSYDENNENVNRSNEYGALVDRKAICGGYSKAFKYLLEGLDVPVIEGFGIGQTKDGTEGHGWNYVCLNNKWYAVDVTWDDPITNVKNTQHKYDYFLKGSRYFNKSHFLDKKYANLTVEIAYPEISVEDY